MVPFSAFATARWTYGLAAARALQRRAVVQHPGRRRRPASAPAPRWTRWKRLVAQLPAGFDARMDRPVLPGAPVRQPGARALRDLAARRVPVPRRALRELVDPARGDARRCRSASSARCSRPRCSGLTNDIYFQVGLLTTIGLRREERDPDRRVRARPAPNRAGPGRSGAGGGAAAAAADPDDVVRVHPRRAAARDRDRRGLGQPERHRHRRRSAA